MVSLFSMLLLHAYVLHITFACIFQCIFYVIMCVPLKRHDSCSSPKRKWHWRPYSYSHQWLLGKWQCLFLALIYSLAILYWAAGWTIVRHQWEISHYPLHGAVALGKLSSLVNCMYWSLEYSSRERIRRVWQAKTKLWELLSTPPGIVMH